jgi:hypothetical protein
MYGCHIGPKDPIVRVEEGRRILFISVLAALGAHRSDACLSVRLAAAALHARKALRCTAHAALR